MIEKIENGKVYIRCQCGVEIVADHVEQVDGCSKIDLTGFYNMVMCDDCANKARAELRKKDDELRKQELLNTITERMIDSKIPEKFIEMDEPFVRHAAAWIFRNRESSMIVGGNTGSGKTSSACFVARLMMLDKHINVKYYSRHTLFAAYNKAKTSNHDSEDQFLARLGYYDLIIIDEMVGRKGDSMLSDSAQELFFNLIDGVYCKSRKTKIWILGNFYKGAIDGLVNDACPIKRRIKESFKLAWIRENDVDEKINLD